MLIVQAPHAILTKKTKRVKKIDKETLHIIEEMKKTLLAAKDPEGVGLAAPQVNYPFQLFITKPTPKATIRVFINPVVTLLDKEPPLPQRNKQDHIDGVQLEGCLSLKDIWGTVGRSKKIRMIYMDEKGKTHEKEFSGFTSIIIQHEYDHLQGILFTRRVLEQKGQLYKSHKNSLGEDEFEEIAL